MTARGGRVAPGALGLILLMLPVLPVLGGCGSAREAVLRRFHVGYPEEVMALVKKGRVAEALDLLDHATLLDEASVALVERLARLNEAAKIRSGPVEWLLRARSRDANLRFGIGRALLVQLGDGRRPTEAQRRLLARAAANARVLVALEPSSARSHFLAGMIEVLRGRGTESPEDYARAVPDLEATLAIDPAYPGAGRALEEARRQAGGGA